jgi:hypothetical protein
MTTAKTPASGRAAVAVRPERCRVIARGSAQVDWNEVPGIIRDIVYLGAFRKVVIGLEGGGTAVVSSRLDDEIPTDQAVSIAFPVAAARAIPAERTPAEAG